MENIEISSEKCFDIELSTDKNNSYLLNFISTDSIEIIANQKNSLINKSFSGKYTLKEIQANNYFLQFETLNEIFDEIKERIINNKIIIEENENNLILNIPLPSSKYKVISFELKPMSKNNNKTIKELTEMIIIQNKEFIEFKNNSTIKETRLDNEIILLKNNEAQLKNEITLLKSNETQLKNEIILLKKNETQLKNEINDLKEKIQILWSLKENKEKSIPFFSSKIIGENEKYIKMLNNWINPSKTIRTELLYRLSKNGEQISTFHELCDNKGPTLTLFYINDGNIVGIYTPLSWDTSGKWKNDMETFIFNLNKNQKYKKLQLDYSTFGDKSYGPWTKRFGCSNDYYYNNMKSIYYDPEGTYESFDKGNEILPNSGVEEYYDLIETEVFKIIIE